MAVLINKHDRVGFLSVLLLVSGEEYHFPSFLHGGIISSDNTYSNRRIDEIASNEHAVPLPLLLLLVK